MSFLLLVIFVQDPSCIFPYALQRKEERERERAKMRMRPSII